jgi:hypothetical protein
MRARLAPHSRWPWIVPILIVVLVAAILEVRHVIARAEPILRTRVIETLSARFKTKVELQGLDVSVIHGLEVSGKGLKIFGPIDTDPSVPGVQPLISLVEFHFHTGWLSLFHTPMHIDTAHLVGLTLNIPPREDRTRFVQMRPTAKQKISITVGTFICDDTHLFINTHKPGKLPLDFRISQLVMKAIGSGQPLRFEARLVNPVPVGNIDSGGKFGPFREDNPGMTPVSGSYSFTHADLGTLKGISGMLSSTGKYRGALDRLEVDGATDTPDFSLARSGHRVSLHTDFHAIVDGTDGDTYLDPVKAQFLHSSFTARGKVVRVKNPHGHEIDLNIVMDHALIQDLLQLGVKTEPTVMSGPVEMKTQMNLSPGPQDIADRLRLDGNFEIPSGLFANEKIQNRIDSLSLRSEGEPRRAAEHAEVGVRSELQGRFRLVRGLFTFSDLHFAVPGTNADLAGVYSLDGQTFDFHGKLKFAAKLSHMTTGWKSILLKPVDPFFQKDGAGAEIPFKVTGTRSAPHFGLDFHHSKAQAVEASPIPSSTR